MRLTILPLALFIVAACGKKEAPPAADTTAMMPPAQAALAVASVETGKGLNADKTLANNTTEFGVRDTIYVTVRTTGTAAAAKLAAKWTFQDGQTVSESTQDIAPAGDANHEFHIQKATAWPKGKYKVEVMLDGTSAGSKEFEIK
jgi:hypothetical protein